MRNFFKWTVIVIVVYVLIVILAIRKANADTITFANGEKVHKTIHLNSKHFETKIKAEEFAKKCEGDVYKDQDGNGFDVIWGNAKVTGVLVFSKMDE